MDNYQELVKQLTYYLSDLNLQNDQFFYDKVASNQDRYVDLDCFLKCNKVKKLGVTKTQQIVQAVKQNSNLELNEKETMIRRKDMKDLPELKVKKKIKKEEGEENKESNPFDKFETVIFTLSLEQEKTVPFRYIQQSLLKNFNLYAPYVRYNKSEGNFAIEKKNINEQIEQKLTKEGVKVGEVTLTVRRAEGETLNEFWDKHGHHYNGIIDNLRKQHNRKAKEEKLAQKRAKKVVEFTFCAKKYDDINKLKSIFKNILCRNPNNTPLKEEESEMVKELLSYHERGADKLKDFKHFVVDVNPSYIDTRCFFVVREDGTREDFSVVKCINKIEQKYAA